jgi:hypothetical protein
VSPFANDAEKDRRTARRISVSDLNLALRLTMPGTGDLALVNISESGALIETGRYLRLDGMADVFVRLEEQRYPLRARVVRVHLQSITRAGVLYQAALQFEAPFQLLAAQLGDAGGSDARVIRAACLRSPQAPDGRPTKEFVASK